MEGEVAHQHRVAGLHGQAHRAAAPGDVLLRVHVHVGPAHAVEQPPAVAPRNDLQAAVGFVGVYEGEPRRHDVQVLGGPSVVERVLVPRKGLDVVAGELRRQLVIAVEDHFRTEDRGERVDQRR